MFSGFSWILPINQNQKRENFGIRAPKYALFGEIKNIKKSHASGWLIVGSAGSGSS